MLALYTATIFAGAGLLFLVQPMIARALLPLLGGSPAVWNTCMVFFQTLLLGGYLYTHLLARRVRPERQGIVHALVLLGAMAALPIGVPEGWQPSSGDSPALWLLLALSAGVGIPFFVLSTTGPLIQHWFSRSGHRHARDPYFLYAASNVGSMLALLAYPLLLEPALGLRDQRWTWSAGFAVYALLVLLCERALRRRETVETLAPAAAAAAPAPAPDSAPPGGNQPAAVAPTRGTILMWIGLAFVPSSLMLGVTQHLATDVATFPLLWVIPLSLYLLSWIIAFSRFEKQVLRVAAVVMPVAAVALAVLLAMEIRRPLWLLFSLHTAGFFVIATTCHARLAATRPDASHLTAFFLWLSVGGALGGAFNSLLAPVFFSSVVEYPLVLALACLLRPKVAGDSPIPWRSTPRKGITADGILFADDLLLPLLVIAVYAAAPTLVRWYGVYGETGGIGHAALARAALPGLVVLLCAPRRRRFAFSLAAFLAVPHFNFFEKPGSIHQERTFFGVHRVIVESLDDGRELHSLLHGTTHHGAQHRSRPWTGSPTTYYLPSGPVGDVFDTLRRTGDVQVGVVGLGAGTLASYGRDGVDFTFFEIDPAVARIAQDEDLFTFLSESLADCAIRLGDARLTLAEEPDGRFDVIFLDAFSSDAIPVHLLTREALLLYLDKLAPDGKLAIHVTNWYLDLAPVVGRLAEDLGLVAIEREDYVISAEERQLFKRGSHWILLAREPEHLAPTIESDSWRPVETRPEVRVWTDDYANLLAALRLGIEG